jgi:hypothetical protein
MSRQDIISSVTPDKYSFAKCSTSNPSHVPQIKSFCEVVHVPFILTIFCPLRKVPYPSLSGPSDGGALTGVVVTFSMHRLPLHLSVPLTLCPCFSMELGYVNGVPSRPRVASPAHCLSTIVTRHFSATCMGVCRLRRQHSCVSSRSLGHLMILHHAKDAPRLFLCSYPLGFFRWSSCLWCHDVHNKAHEF